MKRQPVEVNSIRWRLSAPALLIVLLLLAAGCARGEPTAAPAPAATATAAPAPTATPSPSATATPAAAPQATLREELFLEILEPADESVINEAPLVVVGRTTPDAVVSVDGEDVDVNAEGELVALVALEPGPNLIEVVASDLTGKQETALLSVIYLP